MKYILRHSERNKVNVTETWRSRNFLYNVFSFVFARLNVLIAPRKFPFNGSIDKITPGFPIRFRKNLHAMADIV